MQATVLPAQIGKHHGMQHTAASFSCARMANTGTPSRLCKERKELGRTSWLRKGSPDRSGSCMHQMNRLRQAPCGVTALRRGIIPTTGCRSYDTWAVSLRRRVVQSTRSTIYASSADEPKHLPFASSLGAEPPKQIYALYIRRETLMVEIVEIVRSVAAAVAFSLVSISSTSACILVLPTSCESPHTAPGMSRPYTISKQNPHLTAAV